MPALRPAVVFSRSMLPLFLASLVGVLFWASPIGQRLEQLFGLEWGFATRGTLAPPPSVVYISIGDDSASRLGQPSADINLRGWDRRLFATAVERLSQAGVSAIAFDIMFEDTTPQDVRFAEAIEDAGNVMLLSWLKQSKPNLSANGLADIDAHELRFPPATLLASAVDTPPMMLRRDERADRFYAFPTAAGQLHASLPVVALFLQQEQQVEKSLGSCRTWYATLFRSDQPLAERLRRLRLQIEAAVHAMQSTGIDSNCRGFLQTPFGKAMSGPDEYFLNYYGHRGHLSGPPLHEVLGHDGESMAAELRGKVVLIGVADMHRVNPPDLFRYAVDEDGISGVEVIATAFANLAHQQHITPIDRWLGALLLVGFVVAAGAAFLWLPHGYTPWSLALVVALYCAFAWYLFSFKALWLPIVTPLFVQIPLLIALVWLSHWLKSAQLEKTLSLFLPPGVREKVLKDRQIQADPELMFGICIHTDISGYTALSERFRDDPMSLRYVEHQYWNMMDSLVASQGGQRLEIAGDGMLAVWTSPKKNKATCQRAIDAAQAIAKAVDGFNSRYPGTPFVTRIAVHAGQVARGLVGGSGYFTLTLGGDVANTTARLENDINKLLGTRLVVSESVVEGLPTSSFRRLGCFVPRGKQQLIGAVEPVDGQQVDPQLIQQFELALQLLSSNQRKQAAEVFATLVNRFPDDGPSRFYHRLLSGDSSELSVTLLNNGVLDLNPGREATE